MAQDHWRVPCRPHRPTRRRVLQDRPAPRSDSKCRESHCLYKSAFQLVTHVSITLTRFAVEDDPKIALAAVVAKAKSPAVEFGIAGFAGPKASANPVLPVSFLNARAKPKSLTRVYLGIKAMLCGKRYLRRQELGREQSNLCRRSDHTVHRRFDGDRRNGRIRDLREKTTDILGFGLCPGIDCIGDRRRLV